MRRISVAVLALAVVLAGCSDDDGSPDAGGAGAGGAEVAELADRLAAALEAGAGTAPDAGPLAELAYLDEDPAAVADAYTDVVAGMDGLEPTVVAGDVEEDGGRYTAPLQWSWPVGAGDAPGATWTYEATAELVRRDDDWQVVWQRSVVEPSLADDEVLDATTLPARRGDVTGADGEVLVTERPVVRIGIDRVRVPAGRAARAADELARLVGVDVAPYVRAVRAAGDRAFVEAITFRKGEVPRGVLAGIDGIEGALAYADEMALAPTREFAAPLLGRVGPVTAEMVEEQPDRYQVGDVAGVSGLQARYDEQLGGTPGRLVEAVAEDEPEQRELFRVDPVDGEPLALTLDARLQAEAERVLADVGPASALVALRPSDGAVLAAANGPGTGGLNHATFGQFPHPARRSRSSARSRCCGPG
ncbi:NTF2-like N-terminal transpeptidase domain-containing protein [Nocardioides sp. TF02-7]|uniref:NTF2-like N-terminal transpeptidase domain-containing protein n=1 Tax=Nocardioides sp. TF02-7 TaxID=2917724 RepID=UPI001F05EBF4|nr:NTF2-like N-terminal transpeptidase domain-containing protein [Nocardioides sp. TF02-7]UMG94307.1 hypothetical protein MF408_09990 [Nocardioides sp. TF02-7]